jgi:hypothetical protein
LNPAHQEAALIEIAQKIKDVFPNPNYSQKGAILA